MDKTSLNKHDQDKYIYLKMETEDQSNEHIKQDFHHYNFTFSNAKEKQLKNPDTFKYKNILHQFEQDIEKKNNLTEKRDYKKQVNQYELLQLKYSEP